MSTVLAITGGRYTSKLREEVQLTSHQIGSFFELLVKLCPDRQVTLKHGCAVGTDQHINRLCSTEIMQIYSGLDIEVLRFPVLSKDGRSRLAPKIRNIRMIRTSQPKTEALIAFPGHSGTLHAVNVALKIPIPVWQWQGTITKGRFERIN